MKAMFLAVIWIAACGNPAPSKRDRCTAAMRKVIEYTKGGHATLTALTDQCVKDDWSVKTLDCLAAAKNDTEANLCIMDEVPEVDPGEPKREPVEVPEGVDPNQTIEIHSASGSGS